MKVGGLAEAAMVVLALGACGGGGAAGDAAVSDAAPADAPVGPCTHGALARAVTTLAGCESPGAIDGARDVARFSNPVNVAIAPDGSAYVADFDNHRIRVVDPSGQTRTLVSGPHFHRPFGLAVAPGGTLYVETDDDDADQHSTSTGTVWRVDPHTGAATVVARDLGRPRGLAVLADGRLALADHMHHVVRLLDPSSGAVTLLAGAVDQKGFAEGTGGGARFSQPYDVVQLAGGDLVVSDLDNHRLRRITLGGVVTTYAGAGTSGQLDGPLATATFAAPQGLGISATGAVFVSEIATATIRRIAGGQVTRVAGTGVPGFADADDPLAAQFFGLEGLDVSADGTRVVISDGSRGEAVPYHRVRLLTLP